MKSLQEELKDKDEGQNIHGRCKLLGMSAQQINQDVANHSQHDSIGDAVSQRHKDDTDKRRNGFRVIHKIYFLHRRHHHQTYQNQYGSRSRTRYCQKNGAKTMTEGSTLP